MWILSLVPDPRRTPGKGEVSSISTTKTTRVNQMIRVREVRLIDENGEQLGVLPTQEAMRLAYERNLDLVEVAPNAAPPVCRLLDFGKYQYERQKKEREARRAQKIIEIKEIRLRPRTGEHDIDVKVRSTLSFLEDGSKVKVAVRFRGREITHPEIARDLLVVFAEKVGEAAVVEVQPAMEGRNLFMLLSPNPAKK